MNNNYYICNDCSYITFQFPFQQLEYMTISNEFDAETSQHIHTNSYTHSFNHTNYIPSLFVHAEGPRRRKEKRPETLVANDDTIVSLAPIPSFRVVVPTTPRDSRTGPRRRCIAHQNKMPQMVSRRSNPTTRQHHRLPSRTSHSSRRSGGVSRNRDRHCNDTHRTRSYSNTLVDTRRPTKERHL